MKFTGTSSDDLFTGGGNHDSFLMGQGGNDTVNGGGGRDSFRFDASLTGSERIDGGSGYDTLFLNGDYTGSNKVVFSPQTMINVENITLTTGHSYQIFLSDETIAAGTTLTLDTTALAATDTVFLGDLGESNGNLTVVGGAGTDIVSASLPGTVKLSGGDGNDSLNANSSFRATDHYDGGAGYDELTLGGDYSAGLTFKSGSIADVEDIFLNGAGTYTLTMSNGNVAAGQTLSITGSLLTVGSVVTFDGSRETDGAYVISGGADNDTLIGGQAGNTLVGGQGQDIMTAGAGADTFRYVFAANESTGTTHDTIKHFDTLADRFDMPGTVSAVDTAITAGKLNDANFDADLASKIDAAHLGADHAVLYTPNSGDEAHHTFLIVDANGTAGYQAGQDYVIQLSSATDLGSFGTGNFT